MRHAEPGPAVDFAAGEPLRVEGPVVVRLPEATLVVGPGWRGAAGAAGTIRLERDA